MSTLKMKAPAGSEGQAANIEGHEYKIPASGIIKIVSPLHLDVLKRHGFSEVDDVQTVDADIEAMDDKDELVTFIEERGGEADNSMSFKKLRRLAREAVAAKAEDED